MLPDRWKLQLDEGIKSGWTASIDLLTQAMPIRVKESRLGKHPWFIWEMSEIHHAVHVTDKFISISRNYVQQLETHHFPKAPIASFLNKRSNPLYVLGICTSLLSNPTDNNQPCTKDRGLSAWGIRQSVPLLQRMGTRTPHMRKSFKWKRSTYKQYY